MPKAIQPQSVPAGSSLLVDATAAPAATAAAGLTPVVVAVGRVTVGVVRVTAVRVTAVRVATAAPFPPPQEVRSRAARTPRVAAPASSRGARAVWADSSLTRPSSVPRAPAASPGLDESGSNTEGDRRAAPAADPRARPGQRRRRRVRRDRPAAPARL